MKKKTILFPAVLSLMMMGACSENEAPLQVDDAHVSKVSLTVNYPGNETRTTLTEADKVLSGKWSEGDKLYVYNENTQVGVLDLEKGAGSELATFDGEITLTNGNHNVRIVYAGSGNTPDAQNSISLQRDGTLAGCEKFDVFGTNATVSVNGAAAVFEETIKFAKTFAIGKFKFNLPEGVTAPETMALKVTGSNYSAGYSVALPTGNIEVSDSKEETFTTSNGEVYLPMAPGLTNLKFSTVVEGITYEGQLGDHEWIAGTFVCASDGNGVRIDANSGMVFIQVHFEAGGDNVANLPSDIELSGAAPFRARIEIPAEEPVRTGYEFLGYSDGSSMYLLEAGNSFTTSQYTTPGTYIITLTAEWQEKAKVTYTLNFNSNMPDGTTVSNMPDAMTITDVENATVEFTIPTDVPTATGYAFKGWSTSAGGPVDVGTVYKTTSKSTTVYAIWERSSSLPDVGPGDYNNSDY